MTVEWGITLGHFLHALFVVSCWVVFLRVKQVIAFMNNDIKAIYNSPDIANNIHPTSGLFIWGLTSLSTLFRSGSFMGRGNQYTQLVKVLYCKLPAIGEKLPSFLHGVWV